MRHLALFLLVLAACSSNPERDATTPPTTPAVNDPSYTGPTTRYALVGDAFTPASTTVPISFAAPQGGGTIEAWLDGALVATFEPSSGAQPSLDIPVTDVAPGEHTLLLARAGAFDAFASVALSKGAALYLITATDWDDSDNDDNSLALGTMLHMAHPDLKITHFVGPYTFTDPMVSSTRAMVLAAWVKGLRDTYGDEIGVHIHPWCNFIEAAGVTCATQPSSVYTVGDTTGYTVMLKAYDRAQFLQILQKADDLFAANGLGKPVSFRAGGWTAEVATLLALVDDGYSVDASALNWARMEEWKNTMPFGQAEPSQLYPWNMTQWSTIGDTSQPYQPSEENIQGAGATRIGLLEIPDNAIMVDYVTGQEMIDIFNANWPGGALAQPRQVSIGYHPPNFVQAYYDRLDQAMTYYDTLLAHNGAGPVVYATMHELVPVWPLAE